MLTNYFYILDDEGNPVVENDVRAWDRWCHEHRPATVTRTAVTDEVAVSTIFTAVNYGFLFGEGTEPILFETMIFGGDHDGAQWRYATRSQASAHHDQIVAALRAGECPPGHHDA